MNTFATCELQTVVRSAKKLSVKGLAIGYEYVGDIDHKVASYLTEEWIQHLNFYSTRLDRMGMTLGDVKIASLLDQTVKVEVKLRNRNGKKNNAS